MKCHCSFIVERIRINYEIHSLILAKIVQAESITRELADSNNPICNCNYTGCKFSKYIFDLTEHICFNVCIVFSKEFKSKPLI